MPNVQMVTSNHGTDRVKIQGLDNKYLTFLVDGDRVSGEFAGNIDFSMIGLTNVDKIEVIEGALSTLYGSGAIGGVVNIITKKNINPYWFNSGLKYDDPIGITPFLNTGFNKGIFHYDLNIQFTESNGYDLTPNEEIYNMTLDENKSQIVNHTFTLSPSNAHRYEIVHKDYSSRINKYDYFAGNLILGATLKRYSDSYNKFKYNYEISDNKKFRISYLQEEYLKYSYYPYYYSDNQHIFNSEEFVNGSLNRQEMNMQYNKEDSKYNRLIGLEIYDEDYSSFNIYYPDGIDTIQESIFASQDLTRNDSKTSLYFYEERNFKNNRILSTGIRIQNLNKENILLPAVSYLIKGNNHYNYRVSYSKGYRRPSIKERYYDWSDHDPKIRGNPNLIPTKNNYLSISFDKRSFINDFSMDIYRNDISHMISTEYTEYIDDDGKEKTELVYRNYNEVIINGINLHYYRKIQEKLKLKFVYNYTDAKSNSDEILEGISKDALRISIYYKPLRRIDVVGNIKYVGKKFIFEQDKDYQGNQSIRELASYFISDLYLVTSFKNTSFKIGAKNIFDYKDPDRFISDILNNYDPGRRLFVELSMSFKGGVDDK